MTKFSNFTQITSPHPHYLQNLKASVFGKLRCTLIVSVVVSIFKTQVHRTVLYRTRSEGQILLMEMLPAIRRTSGVSSSSNITALQHTGRVTWSNFSAVTVRPQASLDLNSIACELARPKPGRLLWSGILMYRKAFSSHTQDIEELKQQLISVWAEFKRHRLGHWSVAAKAEGMCSCQWTALWRVD